MLSIFSFSFLLLIITFWFLREIKFNIWNCLEKRKILNLVGVYGWNLHSMHHFDTKMIGSTYSLGSNCEVYKYIAQSFDTCMVILWTSLMSHSCALCSFAYTVRLSIPLFFGELCCFLGFTFFIPEYAYSDSLEALAYIQRQ